MSWQKSSCIVEDTKNIESSEINTYIHDRMYVYLLGFT